MCWSWYIDVYRHVYVVDDAMVLYVIMVFDRKPVESNDFKRSALDRSFLGSSLRRADLEAMSKA